ncbi:MAG: sulfotransferase, partial [Acidobacteriota bacterium]
FDRHFSWPRLGPILTHNPGPRLRAFLKENDVKENEADATLADDWGSIPRLLLPLHTSRVARHLLAVLDTLARRRDKTGWIEKTPRHLRYVPWLERLCPGRVDFVHVIRDGLETVASLHRASAHWERQYGVAECVRRWNRDVAFSLARRTSPRDHFVVYEQLTDDPETVLRRLCHDLDLPWQAEIPARYETGARAVVTDGESWKAKVGGPIRRSGSSDRTLTPAQREQARAGLRHDLYARVVEHLKATDETRPVAR